jgi:hypothetical protein
MSDEETGTAGTYFRNKSVNGLLDARLPFHRPSRISIDFPARAVESWPTEPNAAVLLFSCKQIVASQ